MAENIMITSCCSCHDKKSNLRKCRVLKRKKERTNERRRLRLWNEMACLIIAAPFGPQENAFVT